MKAYLDAFGKSSLYQKTGFLLSMYKKQWRLAAGFFHHCKANIGESTRYLTGIADNTAYDSEWQLCMPKNLSELFDMKPTK